MSNETPMAQGPVECRVRRLSERDIALSLVLEFAQMEMVSFSLMGFYDNDSDFLEVLAERLEVPNNRAFLNKLRRVVQRLVAYGVFYARMQRTSKEYIDEPAKQMNYLLKNGKAALIRKGKTGYTMEPEDEAAFLLRYAYPEPETSNK